jgi:hypothetical protein
MKPTASNPEAEKQFWTDVEDLLTGGKFQHDYHKAQRGIQEYKVAIGGHTNGGGIPEAVYNQGEEKVAEVVDGIIKTGLPKSTIQ